MNGIANFFRQKAAFFLQHEALSSERKFIQKFCLFIESFLRVEILYKVYKVVSDDNFPIDVV